jgi:OOP family OmpA-OmpF porin
MEPGRTVVALAPNASTGRSPVRFSSLAIAVIPALVLAGAARANPPAAAPHVDPKAPSYRWPAADWDGDGVYDRVDHCNNTPRGCTVDELGCSHDSDGDGVCDGLDRCPDTPAGAEVNRHGCSDDQREAARIPPPLEPPREVEKAPERPMSESERQLVRTGRIRLEELHFQNNSAEILPGSEALLREVGETLERYPALRIEIEGHTDTRGSASHNQRLSEVRAETVRLWLLDHNRLNRRNLTARGYGESRPEVRERTPEDRLRNRRVVLTVLNPEALPKGLAVEKQD